MLSRLLRRAILPCQLLLIWQAAGATAMAQGSDAAQFKLSGHYLNQFSHSGTVDAPQQSYRLDLNRLRLELRGQLSPAVALELQYDNEILLGSYLRTRQFGLQKELRTPQFWQLQQNYLDSRAVYARHGLYRAFATFSSGPLDLRVGRQRIAWGSGRFWSPLDLLNPIAVTQLERAERLGVDAVLLERKLDPLSRLAAVHVPQHAGAAASSALYWHGNRAGMDFSVLAGNFAGSRVLGLDLATQIKAAGLRAEWSTTRPRDGPDFRRALLALDYAFANSLTLSAEAYSDGGSAARAYDLAALPSVQKLGQRYLGVSAAYEMTPLLKIQQSLAGNLRDHSRYWHTSLRYSIRTNLDCSLGAQLFSGAATSEYGRMNNLYYTRLQWFF